jgi:hypothetical protein
MPNSHFEEKMIVINTRCIECAAARCVGDSSRSVECSRRSSSHPSQFEQRCESFREFHSCSENCRTDQSGQLSLLHAIMANRRVKLE